MEKKKALLVLAGRRAAPDALALFWLQPQLVIAITSEEGWAAEEAFVDLAKALPSCQVEIVRNINAYDLDAARDACIQVCESYPESEWDWTFTIGSSPKVTGIAAYEVAKQKDLPCWHIDTQHEKLVSLVKKIEVDKQRFFHLDLATYMKIQHRRYKESEDGEYRAQAQNWGYIAREMALSPEGSELTPVFRDKKENDEISLPLELISSPLVQTLEKTGLISLKNNGGITICKFTSAKAAKFLGTGDWLEIYVWSEAKQARFADDHQWGYEVYDDLVKNELDLALMYKAQLLIAECKTDKNPFQGKRNYLGKLDAIANLLGGTYVTQLFVTNQYGTGSSYDVFKQQARQRKIVVVTAEELPKIGEILKREAIKPTYPRI